MFYKVQHVKQSNRKIQGTGVWPACLFGSHLHSATSSNPACLWVTFINPLNTLCENFRKEWCQWTTLMPNVLILHKMGMGIDHQFKVFLFLYNMYNFIIIVMNIMLSEWRWGIKNSNFLLLLKDRYHTSRK